MDCMSNASFFNGRNPVTPPSNTLKQKGENDHTTKYLTLLRRD